MAACMSSIFSLLLVACAMRCHVVSSYDIGRPTTIRTAPPMSVSEVARQQLQQLSDVVWRGASVLALMSSVALTQPVPTAWAAAASTASVSVGNEGISQIAVSYDGVSKPISTYLGKKATLIVNVASQCALTPQYDELVQLYDKFNDDKGSFQILAFPCNQFGSQEPDPIEKIRKDVREGFGVKFPILDKIDVNGGNASPLYKKLKSYEDISTSTNIAKISWNFEKFLVDGSGVPVRRYKPGIRPLALSADVESLVNTGAVGPRKKPALNDYSD
jgi:glutathione peroxidase